MKPAIVYLVTQVGITELRNANRLITEYFKGHSGKLQIVLNRFTAAHSQYRRRVMSPRR